MMSYEHHGIWNYWQLECLFNNIQISGKENLKTLTLHYSPFASGGFLLQKAPDSKVHGANMGPTWVLSAPDGPHVGPMNFAIRGQ